MVKHSEEPSLPESRAYCKDTWDYVANGLRYGCGFAGVVMKCCKACHGRIHRGEYDSLSLRELAYDLRKISITSGLPTAAPAQERDSRKRADATGASPEQELREYFLETMTRKARA